MCVEEIGLGKKGRVGGDQWQVTRISHVNNRSLCRVFRRIAAAAKFDIKALRKQRLQLRQIRRCGRRLTLGQQPGQSPFAAAGKRNYATCKACHLFEGDIGIKLLRTVEMRHRHQAAQIIISGIILRIERQPIADELTVTGRTPNGKERPDNGLHALGFRTVLKRHNTVQAVTIAYCNCRKSELFGSITYSLRLNRTFQHRVGREHAQRDEGDISHLLT